MELITTYKDFTADQGIGTNIRNMIRGLALRGLSLSKKFEKNSPSIQMPYYHHVFEDEKLDFERQLKYLKNFGDFISMDEAVDLLASKDSLGGRYFCLSFDDGFLSCYDHMMEVTCDLDIPAMIYLPTDFINLDVSIKSNVEKLNMFSNPKPVPFLTWDQCKEMMPNGVSFGSHTCSHLQLTGLSDQELEYELKESKRLIEENLGIKCEHFACPWGKAEIHFKSERTTALCKKLGYKSFATTNRGKMQNGDDPFLLKREHVLAHWGNYQLKYFFGD